MTNIMSRPESDTRSAAEVQASSFSNRHTSFWTVISRSRRSSVTVCLGALLKIRNEPAHLRQPEAVLSLALAHRQMHDVPRLNAANQLEHLLAVAGGLAQQQFRSCEEGADVRDGVAVSQLDERAEIDRKRQLRCRDRLLSLAAQLPAGKTPATRTIYLGAKVQEMLTALPPP